jgi:hypothetical protein
MKAALVNRVTTRAQQQGVRALPSTIAGMISHGMVQRNTLLITKWLNIPGWRFHYRAILPEYFFRSAYMCPYDDDHILCNLSVWESIASVEGKSGFVIMTNGDNGWKVIYNQIFGEVMDRFLAG